MTSVPSHAASHTHALWILAVLATLASLKTAAALLIPIVIGLLLSLALEPVVAWLVRRRVPRLAASALVMVTLMGGTGAGVYALKDSIVAGAQALPEALTRASAKIEQQIAASGAATPGEVKKAMPDAMGGAATAVQYGAQSVMALSGHLMVIGFLMFFVLYTGPEAGQRIVAMGGSEERRQTIAAVLHDVNRQLQRFLFVRLLTSVVVAGATWAALAWLGAANAVIWAVLAGVFNSIPYFGPVIVSGGLFVVGLLQGSTADALRMAGVALVITSLEGWLLEPPLMGRAEKMNVLCVFLGLLVWTWLWGAWGTLLAVPMLAVMKSVADRVESLKPLGRLMAA